MSIVHGVDTSLVFFFWRSLEDGVGREGGKCRQSKHEPSDLVPLSSSKKCVLLGTNSFVRFGGPLIWMFCPTRRSHLLSEIQHRPLGLKFYMLAHGDEALDTDCDSLVLIETSLVLASVWNECAKLRGNKIASVWHPGLPGPFSRWSD